MGTLTAWLIGSATPQNMRTLPRPPAKSIANQLLREYSGPSPSGPRRIRPKWLTARTSRKIIARVTPPMYIQLRLVINQSEIVPKTSRAPSLKRMHTATKTTMNPAEVHRISGSGPLFSSFTSSPAEVVVPVSGEVVTTCPVPPGLPGW
jgi:hypothetical protein